MQISFSELKLFTYIWYHKYNFNTYIKIHVIVEYLYDATNLMIIVPNGTINMLMDENRLKIHPTNKMKFLIVAS
jgi:hypothetical protein